MTLSTKFMCRVNLFLLYSIVLCDSKKSHQSYETDDIYSYLSSGMKSPSSTEKSDKSESQYSNSFENSDKSRKSSSDDETSRQENDYLSSFETRKQRMPPSNEKLGKKRLIKPENQIFRYISSYENEKQSNYFNDARKQQENIHNTPQQKTNTDLSNPERQPFLSMESWFKDEINKVESDTGELDLSAKNGSTNSSSLTQTTINANIEPLLRNKAYNPESLPSTISAIKPVNSPSIVEINENAKQFTENVEDIYVPNNYIHKRPVLAEKPEIHNYYKPETQRQRVIQQKSNIETRLKSIVKPIQESSDHTTTLTNKPETKPHSNIDFDNFILSSASFERSKQATRYLKKHNKHVIQSSGIINREQVIKSSSTSIEDGEQESKPLSKFKLNNSDKVNKLSSNIEESKQVMESPTRVDYEKQTISSSANEEEITLTSGIEDNKKDIDVSSSIKIENHKIISTESEENDQLVILSSNNYNDNNAVIKSSSSDEVEIVQKQTILSSANEDDQQEIILTSGIADDKKDIDVSSSIKIENHQIISSASEENDQQADLSSNNEDVKVIKSSSSNEIAIVPISLEGDSESEKVDIRKFSSIETKKPETHSSSSTETDVKKYPKASPKNRIKTPNEVIRSLLSMETINHVIPSSSSIESHKSAIKKIQRILKLANKHYKIVQQLKQELN